MENLLNKKSIIDRSYVIPLYDPADTTKVIAKITVGELIDLTSTFAVGNIVKELKSLREKLDGKSTEESLVNKSVICFGGPRPKTDQVNK